MEPSVLHEHYPLRLWFSVVTALLGSLQYGASLHPWAPAELSADWHTHKWDRPGCIPTMRPELVGQPSALRPPRRLAGLCRKGVALGTVRCGPAEGDLHLGPPYPDPYPLAKNEDKQAGTQQGAQGWQGSRLRRTHTREHRMDGVPV